MPTYTSESIYEGRALYIPSGSGNHVFFCVMKPKLLGKKLTCLLVPMCSIKPRADRTCVLQVGDHAFVRHESFMSFAESRVDLVDSLVKHLNAGTFKFHEEDASDELISKIRAGLRNSERTPNFVLDDFVNA